MNAKKLPSGSWRARAFDKATGKQKSFTAPTKKEAEFLANEWLTGRKKAPLAEKTVKQAIADYIELKRDILSPKTIDTYYITLRRQYSDVFLALPISSVNGVVVQGEINRMCSLFAPKTVHNAHGLLSAALKTYYPELRYNVTLPAIQKRERQLPAASEIVPLFRGHELELVVLLAVWLGLRMSEIRSLRKSDFRDGVVTIRRTTVTLSTGEHVEKDTAKTVESRRSLAVPAPIMELVDALDGDRITELNGRQIYDRFVGVMQAAGYIGVTFHDLRHVNASVMLALGVPDKYAMERGGWSTPATLKRVYQETFSAEREKVDRKIDKYFNNIYEKKPTTRHGTRHENNKPA